jgi:hypothetical protein
MATLTIKIDSEELAREVLTHLGYLPENDDEIPELISILDEDEEPEPEPEPEKEIPRGCWPPPKPSQECIVEKGEAEEEPEPACKTDMGTDLDYVPDSFNVTNAFIKEIAQETIVLDMNKSHIEKASRLIPGDMDRFNYLVSLTNDDKLMIREAAKNLVFEFIANRNLDPQYIALLADMNPALCNALYQYKESGFIIKYERENGI